jgi:hypothetical protein
VTTLKHIGAALGIGLIVATLTVPATGEINWRSVIQSGVQATATALGLGAYLKRQS